MEVMPEQKDTVPAEYAVNTQFLVSGTSEGPPWTGYYATLRGARIAISNIFGVWCEIRRQGSIFEAHRVARLDLSLIDALLNGIDMSRLHMTSEETPTHPSSRAEDRTMHITTTAVGPWGPAKMPKEEAAQPTPFWSGGDTPIDEDVEQQFPTYSSTTHMPPCQPGWPGGTGDDPMTLAALQQNAGYLRLEGNPLD